MSGLYWKEGIDATPPLDKYVTSEVENILSLESTLDKTYDGKAVNGPVVKAGDKVIYSKYAGTEVELEKEEYIIVKQNDILAIVE